MVRALTPARGKAKREARLKRRTQQRLMSGVSQSNWAVRCEVTVELDDQGAKLKTQDHGNFTDQINKRCVLYRCRMIVCASLIEMGFTCKMLRDSGVIC